MKLVFKVCPNCGTVLLIPIHKDGAFCPSCIKFPKVDDNWVYVEVEGTLAMPQKVEGFDQVE